jgi:PadR family transcriptional regulator PadR
MSDLDLMRGTLDVLVLKTLTGGARHGYAVARWIKSASEDALLVEEGALYPALHRLERKGWIEAEWGLSDNNRKAKYYRLTNRGLRALEAETSSWGRYVDAVAKVLASEPGAA